LNFNPRKKTEFQSKKTVNHEHHFEENKNVHQNGPKLRLTVVEDQNDKQELTKHNSAPPAPTEQYKVNEHKPRRKLKLLHIKTKSSNELYRQNRFDSTRTSATSLGTPNTNNNKLFRSLYQNRPQGVSNASTTMTNLSSSTTAAVSPPVSTNTFNQRLQEFTNNQQQNENETILEVEAAKELDRAINREKQFIKTDSEVQIYDDTL